MGSVGKNVFKEHWDWFAAGSGALALVASVALSIGGFGVSPEDASAESAAMVKAMRPQHVGVPAQDMSALSQASQLTRKPPALVPVDGTKANFMASEIRVTCTGDAEFLKTNKTIRAACGLPIPPSTNANYRCPFCKVLQPQESQRAEIIEDVEMLPKPWAARYKFDPKKDFETDPDGDTFTNIEEFKAKTNPTDINSHPPFTDFLRIVGEISQTYLPFWVREANKLPDGKGGWTYRLTLPRLKHGKYEERNFSVKVGEPVRVQSGKKMIDTGYVLKSWTPKTEQRKIAGSAAKKTVDISEAVFVRTADKKEVVARLGVKSTPVDRKVTLVFERGGDKTFTVIPGAEIKLVNRVFEVVSFGGTARAPQVVLKDHVTGKSVTIGAARTEAPAAEKTKPEKPSKKPSKK